MNSSAMIVGGIILVASIFGYLYADNQQDMGDAEAEITEDVTMDWNLVRSISAAGLIGGLLLLIGSIVTSGRDYDYEEEDV